MILVDTNVIARAAQPNHPQHLVALTAIERLRLGNEVLCLVPQVIYEYWVVATRPIENNGLGLPVAEVVADTKKLLSRFRLLHDDRRVFEIWRDLVAQFQVAGKSAHDVRLVAAMRRHGMSNMLTFNVRDFSRFHDVQAVDPQFIAV